MRRNELILHILAASLLSAIICVSMAAAQTTTRVSVASDGTQGNGASWDPTLSADGRYVAFDSFSNNLVPGDTNAAEDVFVHDRLSGVTERISVASNEAQANGNSWCSGISADGRFVLFSSSATNLVAGDTNASNDIFVRDRLTNTTTRASVASGDIQANKGSWGFSASISADGRFIAFPSESSNLVAGYSGLEVYLHDRATNTTELVRSPTGGGYYYGATGPSVSSDGRFTTVIGGTYAQPLGIFRYDRATQTAIALDTWSSDSAGESSSSGDGDWIAYSTSFPRTVDDTNGHYDVFLYMARAGLLTRVSVATDGTQANGDSYYQDVSQGGRFVAFASDATNLVANDTNGSWDVFVHDLLTAQTTRLSVSSSGVQGNGRSDSPFISSDGRFLAFSSAATNLVAGDTNSMQDIFIRDLEPSAVDPLDHFDFSTIPSPQSVSSSFTVTITARNASGARIFEDLELALSATLGQVSPVRVRLVQGSVTVALTLDTSGSGVVISAFGGGATGKSNPFNVNGPPSSGSVAGVVRTASGNPIAGATVSLGGGSGSIQTTSASDGTFSFSNQPCGAHTLRATTLDGRSTGTKSVSIQCGVSVTADLYLPNSACNTAGLRPILLVPGILGSSRPVDSVYPRLPVQPPSSFDSAEWGTWSDSTLHPFSAGGLHDPFFLAGWRHLAEQIQSANPSYQLGCNLFPVPWDWRMPLDQAVQQYLLPAITSALAISGDAKVDIIAHSMGGLLARAYLQSDAYRGDIDKLAMVGTPNLGSVYPYYMWQGGDPITADEVARKAQGSWYELPFYSKTSERLFYDLLGRLPGETSNISYTQDLAYIYHTHVKAMRQLLPTWQALLPNGALQCPPTGTIQWTNDWLNNLNNSPNRNRMVSENGDSTKIRTKIFAGNNYTVANYINVESRQCSKSYYPDGNPTSWLNTVPGDGTVPLFSAYGGSGPGALGAQVSYTQEVTAKHSVLIDHYKCQLVHFMVDPSFSCPQGAAVPLTATGATLTISVVGRPQPLLRAPDGGLAGIDPSTGLRIATLPGSSVTMLADTGTVTVVNPSNGTYSIELGSPYQEDYLLRIAYVAGDTNDDIEVAGFYGGPATVTLNVDDAASPAVHLARSPEPPGNLQADVINSGGLFTQLSWSPVPDPQVVGYNIYSRLDVDPKLTRLGTSAGTTFNTGQPWAANSQQQVRVYAVSTYYADGTESFLSPVVLNNDRDHDGLTDSQEAIWGTSPITADSDGDGLADGQEVQRGTSPLLVDTDGDGYTDDVEVQAGRDPLDPTSFGFLKDGFEDGDLHRWSGPPP
ncbi:MAG TPA: carboxypeptidase regulatory-like domain-containing protein [Thermoanaerobaculia bacterium]